MSEAEAGSIIVEYLALVHTYGEAIWSRIDLWVGVSFGMILLGYFAPERLRPGVAALIVGLYVLFSVSLYFNVSGDTDKATAALLDTHEIAESHGLELNILKTYTEARGNEFYASMFFLFGLFIGTMGFLISVCVENFRTRSIRADSDV